MTEKPFLSAQKICKSFGPTRALVDVDVTVRRGEIRGLIGENGSGKSTFSSIVAGAQRADSGTFELEGKPYDPKHMVDAQNHGISMIVQEMGTIGTISVASNIFIGRLEEYTKLGVVDFKTLNKKANEILADIGASDIKAETLTMRLNFEDRKIVEIARAMVCNPQLLIVDETTTALAHKGRTILYRLIKRMHDENKAVLFISHDLDELVEVCNTITVLRDGHIIDTLDKDHMQIPLMRNLMVGRELTGAYFREDYDGSYSDEVVLKAEHITYGLLEDFSMELHKGEILGIGGLSACGMHELGKVLFGANKTLTGKVTKGGVEITDTVVAVKNNIAYVSKERDKEGIILNASIKENVIVPSYDELSGKMGYISTKNELAMANKEADAMRIKCRNVDQRVSELSGGNKQKVVFAKWLAKDCDVFILDCPTRGIDVGVKAAMYQLIYDLKKQGKAIIMISEELPELIGMSDRMMLMKDGKISAYISRDKSVTEQTVIEHII
ncbi:MAG: sugar ABC transporter ATP-binding protein [Spirochaetales bacterium]|nr:sugar ABC transporter ATP-binding protein [Spirochaetales bacterium]MBQ3831278.1 sugar ABC transporter ATP-binding protein [Spirochaetales bacterium]MBQ4501725.1 sugar ABC transporter ATP-binding protein [Spirochaetales bacterium]MBQ7281752.1 sugar ABC transporter ATP-binding protein [Spirochaetales bacterium]MBQ9809537.1 sugar ABC transporter ATP-binding protein [Spirochaetales bacterium]